MPLSTSILSYPDCRKAFERAIESERGVKVTFRDARAAKIFILRCNQFRKLDRLENKKIYESDTHSLHGRSVFDTIRVSATPTGVIFEKIDLNIEVEDL